MAKILVISNYRHIHSSRPEAEIFIGLQDKGVEVHVMTFEDADYIPRLKDAGIKVIPFHPVKKLNPGEIRTIRRHILDNDIDIVFLFNSKAIINGIQAAKGTAAKVVLYRGFSGHIHWYDPLAYLKYLHPRVDRIICNSEGVEKHIQKALFWAKEKTITINKGHNIQWYNDVKPVPRSELPVPEEAFIAICVANDRKMKGIRYLLQSTYYWPEETPIHLLLVGRGMDKSTYLKLLEDSPNGDKVHLMGFRENALEIVAASDAFVLSSIFGESITKSVLEAMSLGVAPLITDIPGNKELVENGKSGIVVPSKDPEALAKALNKLANDNSLKQEIANNARDRIKHRLSNKRSIEKYYELVQELTGSRN